MRATPKAHIPMTADTFEAVGGLGRMPLGGSGGGWRTESWDHT